MAGVALVTTMPIDLKWALAAFAAVMLVMAVCGWIGYDHWWTERYY